MAAVASNRATFTTFLLALMVTSSWCLASAVPASNARRLKQLSTPGGELPARLLALTAGLDKLSNQVHFLFQTADLPDDVQRQLQQVTASCNNLKLQLQTHVQGLLSLPFTVLAQPQALGGIEGLLNRLAAELETFLKQLQSPPRAGGCVHGIKADLVRAISQLESVAADVPFQPRPLVAALQNLKKAVNQVDPCAIGLQSLLRNGEGVIVAAVGELVASIQ